VRRSSASASGKIRKIPHETLGHLFATGIAVSPLPRRRNITNRLLNIKNGCITLSLFYFHLPTLFDWIFRLL
jgi:hypothetical protein